MNSDTLFAIANGAALAGWALLVFLPKGGYTRLAIHLGLLPLAMSLLYLYGIITGFESFTSGGGFGSIDAVRVLFANDQMLLAGWVHYLAFDLLVGGWIVRDAQRTGIAHWTVVPSLVFTFLLGPIGFMTYWILRTSRRKKLQELDEAG